MLDLIKELAKAADFRTARDLPRPMFLISLTPLPATFVIARAMVKGCGELRSLATA